MLRANGVLRYTGVYFDLHAGMTQVEGARFVAAVSKLTSDQSNSTV